MLSKPKRLKQFAWALGLLILGLAIFVVMSTSRKPMARKKPRTTFPAVRVVQVVTATRQVRVNGEGTVAPMRQSYLATQVAGPVVWVSPSLVNGGRFSAGQILLKIDPSDYQLAITQARARVKEAETTVKLRREEAKAAQEEWRRLTAHDRRAGSQPPPLVAKKPQLASALAALAAARANLKVAKLKLQRTEVKAPYNGRVAAKLADLGQYLRVGERVAEVFGTDAVEIVVHLEDRDLAWIKVPGLTSEGAQGSPAKVVVEFAGQRQAFDARVVRAQGKVDQRTRLVPVVVRVEHPYQRRPPLAVGVFAQVDILGRSVPGVSLLPRTALRQGGVVWVVDHGGTLRLRRVKVSRFQQEQVLITGGLKNGDLVVVSPLGEATDGMRVRPLPAVEETKS